MFLLERVWKTLISLKFAVLTIVAIAISLAIATVIESKYDTRTAQYWIYRSTWFYLLLTVFGLLILAVAISRLPWKKRHTPFLMAHAGILMILIGSAITSFKGVDGNLRITEGEVNSSVELEDHVLVFKKGDAVQSIDFPWVPTSEAESWKPKTFPEYGIEVSQFVSDADAKVEFKAVDASSGVKTGAAIQVKILGAPMGGAPELWLWAGDPSWSTQKLGPARFLIRRADQKDMAAESGDANEARFDFVVDKKGELGFEAASIRGEKKSAKIKLPAPKDGVSVVTDPIVLDPQWRMPIKIAVKRFIANATNHVEYVKVKPHSKGGMGGPPQPAIQIKLTSGSGSQWLGLGDRAELTLSSGEALTVGYFPKRLLLPYALRLQRFEMKHNPGTMDPSAYSSHVQVVDQFQKTNEDLERLPAHEISMNEPLKQGGYTFYQASYIPDFPRAVTTVLSVNYDPGRSLKYSGSLLLVSGSILLYLMKLIQNRKREKRHEMA